MGFDHLDVHQSLSDRYQRMIGPNWCTLKVDDFGAWLPASQEQKRHQLVTRRHNKVRKAAREVSLIVKANLLPEK